MSLLDFLLWVAPGLLALASALAGEWSPLLAQVALLPPLVLFGWLLLLRIRRGAVRARRVGFGLFLATVLVVGQLMTGTPPWLKSDETAAVAAVERWKSAHGGYPDEASAELRAALQGCVYSREPPSYRLLCRQNLLRRCAYSPEKRAWSCGEP